MTIKGIRPRLFSANWAAQLWQWSLLFAALLLVIWLVTQESNAPQLILLLLLYIIAINFSLPPSYGLVGLVPVVAVSSILVTGLETAVLLALSSFLIAEVARPLWNPMWDLVAVQQPSWSERLTIITWQLLALIIGGLVYQQLGGTTLLTPDSQDNLPSLVGLGLGYGFSHLLLTLLHQFILRRPMRTFLVTNGLALITASLLAQPFAIFGGITFIRSGLPLFVIFSLGIMFFSVLNWVSWQRRFVAEQQLKQFSLLNEISLSLRERLDLLIVLRRTPEKVAALVPLDQFAIFLRLQEGEWQKYSAENGQLETAVPDDFTLWAANQQKVLHVHSRNMHHANRHHLTPPQPQPSAWLGIPLVAGEQLIGVMVLQRVANGAPFNRWSQELLLALAGQVSAAIQNARLFSETLRLYNLTDEALARRVEQLQALLDTVAEGVLMLDPAGRVLLVNPTAETILQQAARELQGQTLRTETAVTRLGYNAEEWQEQMTRLANKLPPPVDTALFMLQSPTQDSSSQHRHFFTRSVAAVYNETHQVMGWLIVLRDVTDEQVLAEQRTDLTRMIVHDLRNPVTTLFSTLRQVEKQASTNNDGVHNLLQNAQQTCTDLLDMVDSLMDINRMEAGQLQPDSEAMRLPPLIERVLARLNPLAQQRQITLRYHAPANLPAIWADAELVRRVLINLLDNGLKFTPAGGKIEISFAVETANSDQHEPGIRCIITDSGPGIPPEFRERIFDRFLRTNRGGAQVRGTGLGLTFCKIAIEAQNGRIWAEDAPGGGSQFIFTLPGIPKFKLIETAT